MEHRWRPLREIPEVVGWYVVINDPTQRFTPTPYLTLIRHGDKDYWLRVLKNVHYTEAKFLVIKFRDEEAGEDV